MAEIWTDITESAYNSDKDGYIRFANQLLNFTGVATTSSNNGMRVFNIRPTTQYRISIEMRNRFRAGGAATLVSGQVLDNYVIDPLDQNDTSDQNGTPRTLDFTSGETDNFLFVGGWSAGASAPILDTLATIKLAEKSVVFTVTFKDWDGSVLKTETVPSGGDATAPQDPTREGHTFTGWDVPYSNITSDTVVTAQYEILRFTVRFVDWNGVQLSSQSVKYGFDAVPPPDPEREGYTFTGWDGAYTIVKKDTTINAVYKIKQYTVKFVDWDGTLLDTQVVNYGDDAVPPKDPSREGYVFSGWSGIYTYVTADSTVVAKYRVESSVSQVIGQKYRDGVDNGAMVISRLTMVWGEGEGEYYTSGTDTGEELTVKNPYATQEICDNALSVIAANNYRGYTLNAAYVHPAIELGDIVSATRADETGSLYYVCKSVESLNVGFTSDISAPSEKVINHEYPYEGTYTKAINRRVVLDTPYEGVSISRTKGLVVERSTGDFRAQMTSNKLDFQRKNPDTGSMESSFYYDSSSKKFRIADNVIIDGSLSVDASFTDALYAENGDVSNLTVDRLDTSRKMRKYLLKDTSDDNFVYVHDNLVQWITATVDMTSGAATTTHMTNRYGSLLYWNGNINDATIDYEGYPSVNGERLYIQTDVSDYPVVSYVYTEVVKMEFGFEHDGLDYVPKLILGAGSGEGLNEKCFIFKDREGFRLDYYTSSGEKSSVSVGNDALWRFNGIALKAVAEYPTTPLDNVLYIKGQFM